MPQTQREQKTNAVRALAVAASGAESAASELSEGHQETVLGAVSALRRVASELHWEITADDND